MQLRWFLFVVLFLVGCKDPYNIEGGPKSASSPSYGSLQDVYKEKKFNLATKAPEIWKVPLGTSPQKGDKNAVVTIVEFSDFECPFCSRGAKTLETLTQQYQGKVRYAFKHFPLSFHKNAHLASQASIEAMRQGKFWQYHDKLFANQRKLQRSHLDRYAREIGLDMARFKEALDKKTHAAEVDEDMKLGAQVGVQGTPTAFVNGRLASALTDKDVKGLIDDELERLKPQIAKGQRGDALYNAIIEKGKQREAAPPPRPRDAEDDKPQVIAVGEAPTLGPDDAPVTIVEFSDFECPYCVQGAQAVKKVARAYGDKVRVVFKHYPLGFHFAAKGAAAASMAAHQQGKFWAYHDLLFAGQKNLTRPSLLAYARSLELDMDSFTQALDSVSLGNFVDEDIRQGNKIGVRGTPTFFINGQKLSSGLSFSAFKEAIDPILLQKGYKKTDLPEEPGEEITLGNSAWKGAETPLATVVEFSDFECPYCSRAASTLSALAADYKKYVRFVFKHYPLSFHKNAHLASQASIAAQEQGKFWEYHDKLFANQRNLLRADLERYAQEIGLDMDQFKKALDSGIYKGRVDLEMAEGTRIGVSGTPSFFVEGKKATGVDYKALSQTLNEILSKKGVPTSELPSATEIPLRNSAWKGAKQPLATVVEFSDFECPYCSRAANTLKQLEKTYGRYVRFVFKHYPLSFHKNAHLASQASIAARAQGKFWEYHDKLFANQRNLLRTDLDRYAQEIGLDMDRFRKDLDSGRYKEEVDADMSLAGRFGVGGTPSFYVNNEASQGASFGDIAKKLNDILIAKGVKASELPDFSNIPTQGSAWKGAEKARVEVVEFSDFECPFCSKAALTLQKLATEYKDRVRFVFKHYPLSFHKNAHLASQAAMVAQEQGKFWEYHDKLFANYSKLQRADLERYAQEVGMNVLHLQQSLDSGVYKEAVDKDMEIGERFGVSGTPTFFVNNTRIKSPTYEDLKAAIEAALKAPTPAKTNNPTNNPNGSLVPSLDLMKAPAPTAPSPTRLAPKQENCAPGTNNSGTCAPPSRR